MEKISEFLMEIVSTVNQYLSNYILIFLLVGVGLFYTIKTRFVQVRCFGEGMKKVFGNIKIFGKKDGNGLSSFQALATAIAAQVGTGNIVGASGAILVGGPGAIFWMWVIAFFGMATIYAEAVLAVETRETTADGGFIGGPVFYIKKAFKGKFGKFLAGFFAVAIVLALGFIGSMVQSNSISDTATTALSSLGVSIEPWVIGLVLAAVAAFIFVGGIKRIASVTEKIVPLMAVIFLVLGLVILAVNIKWLPEAFGMIFKYAFNPTAVVAGSLGYAIKEAISQGAKRGLFSNEAGMGSTPHAHALADVKKPHDQGVVAMIGVFIDTFVVLTMTALVVITVLYSKTDILNRVIPEGTSAFWGNVEISKNNMMQLAFGDTFGSTIGNVLVAVCLFFFAFSTIIGWNYFGKVNFQYLFGKKATVVYSVLSIGFIFLGSCFKDDLVWELADMFNNIMVIPNVMALVPLFAIVVKASKSNKQNDLGLKVEN